MVELLLGFLETLPLVLHLKQTAFIPLRYDVIHSLHMLCDSFKPASPSRCLTKYLRLNTHEFSSAHRLGLNTHRSSHLDKLKMKYSLLNRQHISSKKA